MRLWIVLIRGWRAVPKPIQGGGSNDSLRQLLLWRGRIGGHRRAGGHGLLSLPFLSFLVRRPGERLQPLEAGGRANYLGSGECGDVPENRDERTPVLREMWRTP